MLNAAQITEKWARKSGQATQDYQNGVESVTESPMEKAASQGERAKQGYVDSINSGRWQAGLRRTSLAQWKSQTKNVGGQRYSSGIQAAKGKYNDAMQGVVSHIESGLASLPDRGDFDTNMQRMDQFVRHMKQYKK